MRTFFACIIGRISIARTNWPCFGTFSKPAGSPCWSLRCRWSWCPAIGFAWTKTTAWRTFRWPFRSFSAPFKWSSRMSRWCWRIVRLVGHWTTYSASLGSVSTSKKFWLFFPSFRLSVFPSVCFSTLPTPTFFLVSFPLPCSFSKGRMNLENANKSLQIQFFSIGCISSAKSMENYTELERVHTLITSIIFKTTMIITYFLFSLDALLPISYALFKRPDPDHWITVFGFQ